MEPWVIGVILALLSAAIINGGYNLQKYVLNVATHDEVKLGTRKALWLPQRAGARYTQRVRKVHRFAIASLAGIMGAQSVLFAKAFMELIKSIAVSGDLEELAHVATYIIPSFMLATVLIQVALVNRGLRQFSSYYILPVYQSFWILFSIAGGVIYFEEFDRLATSQIVFFCVGALLTLGGVLALSSRSTVDHIAEADDNSTCCLVLKRLCCISNRAEATAAYGRAPWVIGLILVIFGSLLDLASFSFAAQSLLAPLAAFSMICNAFICYFLLSEPVTWLDLLGVLCTFAGATLCVIFATHEDHDYTVHQLIDHFLRVPFLVYLALIVVTMVGLYLFIHYVEAVQAHELKLEAEEVADSPQQPQQVPGAAVARSRRGSRRAALGEDVGAEVDATDVDVAVAAVAEVDEVIASRVEEGHAHLMVNENSPLLYKAAMVAARMEGVDQRVGAVN